MIARTVILAALPLHAAFALQQYSPSDLGSSPIPVGAGTRALAMGGAFIAIADDASAATWNPAGMTQLERPEASLSGGYYWRRATYASGSRDTSTTDLDHAAVVVPFFLGVQQTLGLAWQRQFDFTKGQSLTQNETVDLGGGLFQDNTADVRLNQHGAFASLGLSYAIEVAPRFSLGVTVLAWNDDLTGRSAYDKTFTQTSEQVFRDHVGTVFGDELTTFTSHERVAVDRGYSEVIGVMWQVNAALSLGANWKPSYRLHLAHHEDRHQRTDDLLTNSTISQSDTNVSHDSELRYPSSAAIGAAWRFDDSRTLSLDVTWTRWREYTTTTGDVITSPVNNFISPNDYQDGYAVRIGYEHICILPRLVVVPRIGAFWENVPGATATPDTLQPQLTEAKLDNYYGITAGLGLFQRHILYEVAGQFRFADGVVGVESAPDEREHVRSFALRAGIALQF